MKLNLLFDIFLIEDLIIRLFRIFHIKNHFLRMWQGKVILVFKESIVEGKGEGSCTHRALKPSYNLLLAN